MTLPGCAVVPNNAWWYGVAVCTTAVHSRTQSIQKTAVFLLLLFCCVAIATIAQHKRCICVHFGHFWLPRPYPTALRMTRCCKCVCRTCHKSDLAYSSRLDNEISGCGCCRHALALGFDKLPRLAERGSGGVMDARCSGEEKGAADFCCTHGLQICVCVAFKLIVLRDLRTCCLCWLSEIANVYRLRS